MSQPTHPIDDDRLIDFVHHLLPPEQERAVLAHLRECASCEARLKHAILDRELARTKPAPTVRGGVVVPGRHRPRSRVRIQVAAAIAAAVVVAALGWLGSRESKPDTYWMPIELERTTLRSEAPETDANLGRALESYGRRDARGTIELLREAPVPQDEMFASVQRLMLASALTNVGDYAEALRVIEKLDVPSLPLPWRSRGLWIEYLGLRGAGMEDEAIRVLEELASDPGEMGTTARRELGRRAGD